MGKFRLIEYVNQKKNYSPIVEYAEKRLIDNTRGIAIAESVAICNGLSHPTFFRYLYEG